LWDFRLLDQYYWSDQNLDEITPYDAIQMGTVAAFTFQDEFFAGTLRGINFHNVQVEYAPTRGRAGFRLALGAFRMFGDNLPEPQASRPLRGYWEIQAAYATALGPLRAGLCGLDGERPMAFLRFGADIGLEQGSGPQEGGSSP
jgi:hypothetical protein